MPEISRRVLITGIVQGVWFRACTKDAAEDAGLKGWVRNLPNGHVEALFQGEPDRVQQAIDWCWKGPPGSRVENVVVFKETVSPDLRDFVINRTRGFY